MRKSKEKHIRLTEKEMDDLKTKAEAACLSESEYIRQLISGVAPVVIDDRFFAAMQIISEFAEKIEEVAMKADNSTDMIAIMSEAKKWRAFRNAIEQAFVVPRRIDV